MKKTAWSSRVLLGVLLVSSAANGQTSVVQDAKGETSLNWGQEGVVAVNAKDESLSFSYGAIVGDEGTAAHRKLTFFGIKAKGKAKNSLSSVIKNDDFQFDGSFGFFVFRTLTHLTGPTDRTDHIYISADYLLSRFKLFDASQVFDKQLTDEGNGGSRFTIGYNQENSFHKRFSYVFGLAASAGQKNNTDELKALGVSTTTTVSNPATGQVRSIARDAVSAYEIGQYKNSLGYLNVNMDIGPQIGNRFLFLVHPRYAVLKYREPQFNPAAGIYLTKDKAPLEVVAGIQVQVQDYFNTAHSEKSRGQRTVINLVAGYVF